MQGFRKFALLAGSSVLAAGLTASAAQAQEQLTLCWAAWDPANALVELSKDFTAETGIEMKFEFVPWTNYADRFLNELNSHGKLCDLIIGDSQWIGGSAENGHYVKLNDFFDEEGITMDDFLAATVVGYSQWPKGTPNYWALPAMGDVVGWTYRKDWFERPGAAGRVQGEVRPRPRAAGDLDRAASEIAEFFQGREIDGKTVYGASIYTERGSEGITMGATDALYSFGFKYQNPDKPYEMEGFVNSPGAVAGLEFYKALYDCCTPPGASNIYMGEGVDAFKSGQVAMQMNFAFTGPACTRTRMSAATRSASSSTRPRRRAVRAARRPGHLGGRLFRQQDGALNYIKWFAQPDVQAEVVAARRLLVPPSRWSRIRASSSSAPYAADFLDSMAIVQDFWAEPTYA